MKVIDYVSKNPDELDRIKGLSKLEDVESVDLKFLYDKLLLISREEWKRILDIGQQTKIFDNLELANIKLVQTSLLKKEKVKEQALIKCDASLKKLKKYGRTY